MIRRLTERVPGLWLSRSWTTRPRRAAESEDAYHFVDRETFERRVAESGFLEWAKVLDDLYGTPVPEPPEGYDVLLEIDVQGARQVLSVEPEAVCIMLVPPSVQVQRDRLVERGDSEEHVRRRIELGAVEEAEGRLIARAVIVNEDLEAAVEQVAAIIASARAAARERDAG